MTQITVTVPPMECPDVQLPTPANLTNLFGTLITKAERAALSEVDELKEEGKKLKEILDKVRAILSPYDPEFERVEIPEKEYEIMISRMISEYSTYVQAKMLEIVGELTPIEVNITLLGIEIDVVKFATDRSYRSNIIAQADVDSVYDLLPAEYQDFKDKFDSKDLRAKNIQDYLEEKIKEFQTGNFLGALEDLGLSFTLPTDPRAAVKLKIDQIKEDTQKDIDEKIEDFKTITIGGKTLDEILGGEFDDNVEISEFTMNRLTNKLRQFAEDYWAYLIKEMLTKITDAIKAIPGLDKIIEFLTFTFCDFLTLIGFPKTIDLSGFSGIQQVPNVQPLLVDNLSTTEESSP